MGDFDMILWMIAATAAFFVKGLAGFANTLVFSTILSFSQANAVISPTELLLSCPSGVVMVIEGRKHINWKICGPLLLIVVLGSIPGILLLKNVDAHILKIVFGAVIVFMGVWNLIQEFGLIKRKFPKAVLTGIGFISGVMMGLFGIGALLSAYMSQVTDDTESFKANLNVVFVAENLLRIILYAGVGILTWPIVKRGLLLIPFMTLGLMLGMLLSDKLNEKIVKRIVMITLIISGIFVIINAF